jgi:endonuclease/exonuclease/phosphatase family metal-dependent hydrolase
MIMAPRSVRIATYNVHSCIGTDGRCDPERISRVIAELDADVVALQEFRYPADIALETRQTPGLGLLAEYQCALGPTLARRAESYGNVLLTRHPIRELQRIDLSHGSREPRGALATTIEVGGATLHVLSTHLGLKLGERRFQVARILEHVESMRSQFLAVLGDFNDWLPGRSVVHALEERLGRAPRPRSFPVHWPLLALDRIWIQPASTLREVRVHKSALARRASDHFPVVAIVDPP